MNYYFVGIGGIGMSALAQLLAAQGNRVEGVDREETPTTTLLKEKGIQVHIGHGPLPEWVETLVYSDAVPSSNGERTEARQRGVPEQSYFETVGAVSKKYKTVAIAGTHGKTTTTGMLTKILVDQGVSPSAIIGSIVRDFGSNFVAGTSEWLVVEACEYKNHLLHITPDVLVLNNVEYDHTDFFSSLEAVQDTFAQAALKVPEHGAIITNPNDPSIVPVITHARAMVIDYTTEPLIGLALPGVFNQHNAQAALAAARIVLPSLDEALAQRSLNAFKGSWRRFELKGHTKSGALVYDDYAHHPTAVLKTIEAARVRFPDKKITVVFHPHLFSRTRDLFDGFVGALATADRIILAPIYAAREIDQGDVSSDMLGRAIEEKNKSVRSLCSFEDICAELLQHTGEHDLIITMGAGDIYKVAELITHE